MNAIIARYRFHAVAVAALAAAVFAGFAKTYYFRAFSGSPPLAQAAHVHGLIASVWIVLHYTQARLVAAHRVDLHRRLGIFAAVVAAMLAAQAIPMAIGNAAAGHAPAGRDPLQFLSVPIGTTTMFTLFVGSALALRRSREWHKRLMLLATMTLLVPAMGRLDAQIMQPLGLPRLVLAPAITVASSPGHACTTGAGSAGSIPPTSWAASHWSCRCRCDAGSDSPTRGSRSLAGSWE